MSIKTHKRTLTDGDIVNFANLTWDHFYAHTDITSLGGTIFEKRAAHGYFILAAAAGLFVYPNKGPVQANYGLDECRFVRPLYHNDTFYVRLTCKEKQDRDSRGKQFPSGVVKWFVEVFDQDDEKVAIATILTMVQKKSPFKEINASSIRKYLSQLTADTPAAWGIMTAQHMMEHLEYFMKMAVGEIETTLAIPEDMVEKYQESLYNYRRTPKSYQHPHLRKNDTEDLIHPDFNTARESLIEAYDNFEKYFKENPEATSLNSMFGVLDKEMWDLINLKHFNHHFEQFGLLDNQH